MNEGTSSKKLRWVILFGLTGVVDAVQILIDLTGIGILASEAIDAAMPFVLIGLLILFKIPIFTKPARLFSILGVTAGDALTGGVAPFWILDVWYLYRSVRKDELEQLAADTANAGGQQPLYREGVRAAEGTPEPLNTEGVRLPSGREARGEENPQAA